MKIIKLKSRFLLRPHKIWKYRCSCQKFLHLYPRLYQKRKLSFWESNNQGLLLRIWMIIHLEAPPTSQKRKITSKSPTDWRKMIIWISKLLTTVISHSHQIQQIYPLRKKWKSPKIKLYQQKIAEKVQEMPRRLIISKNLWQHQLLMWIRVTHILSYRIRKSLDLTFLRHHNLRAK